jgi:crotonobetainyl-CoA:carnitine CoA-transferase CaiB-like acyl-CoA transferase
VTEGRATIERLMSSTDIVVENFKAGVADRLGIGYARAADLKPDVVYCSISGYGQTGPLRNQPGFDQQMQAYAGHLSVTGEPGRPPVRIGPSSIDITTGAHAAFGILAALRVRDLTGQGQWVETSLYDSAIHMVSQYVADCRGAGKIPEKLGPFFAFLSPYGVYEAADREIYLGPSGDRMVAALFRVLGRSDMMADPRFRTNRDRVMHRDELHAEFIPVIRTWAAADLLQACVDNEIPASLIENIAEVAVHAQALAREMVIDTGVGGVRSAGIPVKLSLTPGTVRLPPPTLGNANATLLEGG